MQNFWNRVDKKTHVGPTASQATVRKRRQPARSVGRRAGSKAKSLLVLGAVIASMIMQAPAGYSQKPTLASFPSTPENQAATNPLGRNLEQASQHRASMKSSVPLLSSGQKGIPPSPRIKNLARLPLSFEANKGQVDERVKYLARGKGYTLFLTETEAVLSQRSAGSEKLEVKSEMEKLTAEGERPKVVLQGGGTAAVVMSSPGVAAIALTENVDPRRQA
ncbi:MAG: hypothetical protein OEZ05_01715 [Nitrospirota bacterium]|nr:hypothetical protein [Nitrospirota bacterium]